MKTSSVDPFPFDKQAIDAAAELIIRYKARFQGFRVWPIVVIGSVTVRAVEQVFAIEAV